MPRSPKPPAAPKPARPPRVRGPRIVDGSRTRLVLDQRVQKRLVQALAKGNYREVAATYAGISKQAFYNYLNRGRAEREEGKTTPFTRLLDAIEAAEAKAEVAALAAVWRAKSNWQAHAWFLERKFPDKFGRIERIRKEDEDQAKPPMVIHAPQRVQDDDEWLRSTRPTIDVQPE